MPRISPRPPCCCRQRDRPSSACWCSVRTSSRADGNTPMAKTTVSEASVDDFLDAIRDDEIRVDAQTIAGIMRRATKAAPKLWGKNIIGFSTYRMTYANGETGDWPIVALAPR